jgi:hypothetical protein
VVFCSKPGRLVLAGLFLRWFGFRSSSGLHPRQMDNAGTANAILTRLRLAIGTCHGFSVLRHAPPSNPVTRPCDHPLPDGSNLGEYGHSFQTLSRGNSELPVEPRAKGRPMNSQTTNLFLSAFPRELPISGFTFDPC